MEAILRLEDIGKIIKGRAILSDISFQVNPGEIVGLIGHNGSGKTMLLKIILGLVKPTSGRVLMAGQEVQFNEKLPLLTGAIIENTDFIPYYTGLENLRYLSELNDNYNEEKILAAFDRLHLSSAKDTPVRQYSLGMRQKLAIIQAVMEDQPLVLLDEPTNGLDQESVRLLIEWLKELRAEGRTFLIATHDTHLLERFLDRQIAIADGRLRRE